MMRLFCTVLIAFAFAGCNLSDPLSTFAGNEVDMDTEGDTGGTDSTFPGDGFTVLFSAVTVNGADLPATAPARAPFEVAGEFFAENADDCEGCNIQLIVGLTDGATVCLYDGPAGDALPISGELQAADTPGSRDLLWDAVELQDCTEALATVDPQLPIGIIVFTDPPPLAVLAITPDVDETDVVVTSDIRISFDEDIDAASAQGRVTLTNATGPVAATMTVMGAEIILTPDDAMTELQTDYNVLVTAGVTSAGRALEDDFTSSFTTQMFVPEPGVWYAASNELHTALYSLGIDTANQCLMILADDTSPSQRFRFVVRPGGGWVAINAAAITIGRALDGDDGISNCKMSPLTDPPLPAQVWNFVSQPTGPFFLMQNTRLSTGFSLDGKTEDPGLGPVMPVMQPTTAISRQFWRWRRLP